MLAGSLTLLRTLSAVGAYVHYHVCTLSAHLNSDHFLNSINSMVFVMDTCCVLCCVGATFFNTV
jgi:hypothetical protein